MRAVVAGESLVDLVWRTGADVIRPVPGGSPAHVAVGLHRLGHPVTLITSWGDGPPGTRVGRHLATTGLDVLCVPATSARTTVALAYVDDATGSETYDFLATWTRRTSPSSRTPSCCTPAHWPSWWNPAPHRCCTPANSCTAVRAGWWPRVSTSAPPYSPTAGQFFRASGGLGLSWGLADLGSCVPSAAGEGRMRRVSGARWFP